MKDCKDESRCLASLAVFRELYNSKKDVYGIISEFLKEVIISEAKHQFSLTEITKLLNDSFDFHLPEAIVLTALRRIPFIEKQEGRYIAINLSNEKRPAIYDAQKQLQSNNNIIIEQLFTFIQEKQNNKLTDSQKEKVVNSFCSFLLDDSNGHEYSEFISAFIISKGGKSDFTSQLNIIKEGVVLYSGIKYNSNINDLGSWTTPLTIYIETEILFHFAGYNGELYRTLFLDFLSFVKEINTKSQKKLIQLKYFQEVKDEIERFFKKAEYLVEGKDRANPSITAMGTIINGCVSPGDIIAKKTLFYDLLTKNGIQEDEYNEYFAPKNHKYNIIDQAILDKISNELQIENINETLKFLNYISIHRKEASSNNFENSRFILLSGNSTTIRVAWHNDIKGQGSVPLATNLSFITNKFWFKLNKGFGQNNYPKTFDIITKAQIILSTQLNDSVRIKYEELQAKFRKGELTEKQAIATIASLRNEARKPEEIRADDISIILNSISEEKIEKYLEEHEHIKNKAIKEAEDNIRLKQTLSLKDNEIIERQQKEQSLSTSIIESKKQLLEEKSCNKEALEKQKIPIDNEVRKAYIFFKLSLGIILVIYVLTICSLIWKFGWDTMEPIIYIIGLLTAIFVLLYLIFIEKTYNPLEYIKKQGRKIEQSKYKQFNFDLQRLNTLEQEIINLEKEIENHRQNT